MFNNKENRIGAFSGMAAAIFMIALTMMAFVALEPPRERHAVNWDISAVELPEGAVAPSLDS
jgi:hypothetical protein